MSVKCVPPQTPLLYSKTGVCRGIPGFIIFGAKHTLWVLVFFLVKFSIFTGENNLHITWESFRNDPGLVSILMAL